MLSISPLRFSGTGGAAVGLGAGASGPGVAARTMVAGRSSIGMAGNRRTAGAWPNTDPPNVSSAPAASQRPNEFRLVVLFTFTFRFLRLDGVLLLQ